MSKNVNRTIWNIRAVVASLIALFAGDLTRVPAALALDEAAIREYVTSATTRDQGLSIIQDPDATARFVRLEEIDLNVITIVEGKPSPDVVSDDLRLFSSIVQTVGKKASQCEVNVEAVGNRLPKCAQRRADIVFAYLASPESPAIINDVIERLHFRDERTVVALRGYVKNSLENIERGYCLGGVSKNGNEIGAAYLLTDQQSFEQHTRCTAFFSYSALGVTPVELKSLFQGRADDILNALELGPNARTALRFLYSDGVNSGMAWKTYLKVLDDWLRAQKQ
ncbi:hypothetical protein [Dongia sp.]|uniref:hypothetical protein n=1 Tax=Dongia sp. TaxID=1977262 RepID=UPI0035B2A110